MTHSSHTPAEPAPVQSDLPIAEPELQNLPRCLHPVFKVLLGITAALAIGVPCLTGIQTAVPIVNGFMIDYQVRKATGTIHTPLNGAKVNATVNFEGTLLGIPKSSSLWLVIYDPAVKKYYPYELPDSADARTWRLPNVAIGSPTDHDLTFTAALYLLNTAQTEQYRQAVVDTTHRRGRRYAAPGVAEPVIAENPVVTGKPVDRIQRAPDRGMLTQPPGKLLQVVSIQRSAQ